MTFEMNNRIKARVGVVQLLQGSGARA